MSDDSDRKQAGAAVPRTLQGRVAWLAARAVNVPRRPLLVGVSTVLVFTAALAGLMAIPYSAIRTAEAIAPQPHERPDTAPLIAATERARRDLVAVETSLSSARALIERWVALPPPTADTLSLAVRLRRDSLERTAIGLAQLRERVETAPLLASYRALAESPELRSRVRVRQLLDSLTEIERAREQVGGVGGVDPVFVALTERAAEIGREIRQIAESRIVALQLEVERLNPPPPPAPPPPPRVDTLGLLVQLDPLRDAAEAAERELARARRIHEELDERMERARAIASIGASPFAIFAAAMVLGICFGFGIAFVAELRSPRVGTSRELEWLAGAPLLAVIRDAGSEPERARRRADQLVPAFIQQMPESYRDLYGRLADRAYNLLPTTVVADDAMISAVVAANIAAVSSQTARATMLLDTDGAANAVAAGLGVASTPGLSDLLHRRAEWVSAVKTVLVGRDRVLEVIPAGAPLTREQMLVLREPFSGEVEYFRRRYDTLVVSAPADSDGAISPLVAALPQAVVCARAGRTTVSALLRMLSSLRDQGVIVRGVLLWDDEDPEAAPSAAASQALAGSAAR